MSYWRSANWLLPTLLISSLLFVQGARMTMAGLHDQQAKHFLQDWTMQGNVASELAWELARDASEAAIAFYPVTNGRYLEQAGLVYQWQTVHQPYGIASAQASRLQAENYYRQAIQARPLWPDQWAHLAQVLRYQNRLSDDFDQALQQAVNLGPWRAPVNRELAIVGLTAWSELSDAQKALTREMLSRTLQHAPRDLAFFLDIARDRALVHVVCQSVPAEQRQTVKRHCGPVRKPSYLSHHTLD